jgi:hypothetical protein
VTFVPVLSNTSFAVPLLLVVVVGLLWWWASRVTVPPRLVPTPAFHSWRVNPVAAAYESLQQDRYLLAAYLLRERLADVAWQQFQVTPRELRPWAVGGMAPPLPEALTYRRLFRDLTSAYRSAYLAEVSRPSDLLAGYLGTSRRRRAARDFGRAATEVEQVLTAWSSAS